MFQMQKTIGDSLGGKCMHTWHTIRAGFLTALFAAVMASPLHAGTEYQIIRGGTGPNVYASLEAFCRAGVVLANGDSIVLYNDDATLTQKLVIPNNTRVTIKSSGGRHAITGAPVADDFLFDVQGNEPRVTLENIAMTNNTSLTNGVVYMKSTSAGGILNISDAILSGNSGTIGAVAIDGAVTAAIANTVIADNANAAALLLINALGESSVVNIAFDAAAPARVAWSGNAAAIAMGIVGTASLTFDLAAGKTLEITDSILQLGPGTVAIEKIGQGTLKFDKATSLATNTDLNIRQGTMHFGAGPTSVANSVIWAGNNLSVASGAVFKPTVDAGNLAEVLANPNSVQGDWSAPDFSRIVLAGAFTAAPGARLEIGNVSTMPQLGDWRNIGGGMQRKTRVAYGIVVPADIAGSALNGMSINNALMSARLFFADSADPFAATPDPTKFNSIWLEIDRLNNLDTLDGLGTYADIYRRLAALSPAERDFLDSFYARGGDDANGMAYLQTLGGATVQNSLLAMRQNLTSLQRNIGRRFTRQPRETAATPTANMTEFQRYFMANREEAVIPTGEIWAYVDNRWINQDDFRHTAGYVYNPYGLGLGFDKKIGDVLVGGVARYDTGKMKLKAGGDSRTDIDSLLLSAYGSWTLDKYYFGGGAHFGYGWNDSLSSYAIPGMNVTARSGTYGTSLFGLSTEFGYMWDGTLGGRPFRLTPYGGLGFARIGRNGFTESGAGTLDRRFGSSYWNVWDLSLGFKMAMPIELSSVTLIPSADISFVSSLGAPKTHDGDVSLLSNPTASWHAPDIAANQSGLHVETGLAARFGHNWDLGMMYEFEWRRATLAHRLDLNVSKGF